MFKERRRRIIALFFLLIFSFELLSPLTANALTSGPSQPEMAKFEPAGTNDLVDLFTGDLKYNIPLLDVGGYPVNLAYNSGSGVEDEASWVGVGWTLNPGAVNRTMRGLPDDFDGAAGEYGDKVEKTMSKKEFKKVGASLIVKPSLFGWEFGKASFKVNVYKDNYYGMGASIGAGADFNLSTNTKTQFTAGLGLDIDSDVREGVDISPNMSLSISHDLYNDVTGTGTLSGGFNYNTRAGLKETSLGLSYSTSNYDNGSLFDLSYTRYFGRAYPPIITMNTENNGYTASLDGGLAVFGLYFGLGGTGSYYKEKILNPTISVPAFGYMNYLKGRKNENALLDFNREKEGVFLRSSPSLPIPVATHDFFVATSQAGSQQFRPYFGGNYVVFDRRHTNTSNNTAIGLTVGAGNIFKSGGRVSSTKGGSETRKWKVNNQFLNQAEPEFPSVIVDPSAEPIAIRQQGERTRIDINDNNYQAGYLNSIGNYETKKVDISSGPFAYASLKDRNGVVSPISQPMKRTGRDNRSTTFSYLTAQEASKHGLDKKINGTTRFDNITRKAHHISEITVTDNDGKRMVYGIPVYNKRQTEVTFSVKKPIGNVDYDLARKTGLIPYTSSDASTSNKNGRDWYFSKETTPAYATSFLLTAILSPDYVDRGDPGITDDDLGTAVKFNYTKNSDGFKWRAPYEAGMANYNEGLLSDPKDDKGSYVYGEKEIWHLESIESKTMIAVFKTSVREDGLGVSGELGGKNTNAKLEKLDCIKLYSKADWLKNQNTPENLIPIKEVYFEYDYSLYPGVSNNSGVPKDKNGEDPSISGLPDVNAAHGKLTLKKVYFKFGGNSRGVSNPYEFEYDLRVINDGNIPDIAKPGTNDAHDALEGSDMYAQRQTDRWGTYKQSFYNRIIGGNNYLNNSEFPYALQKNAAPDNSDQHEWSRLIDRLSSKWQLSKIITPTNSMILVEYESDDYAFVQDRRAMQMCFVKDLKNDDNPQDHRLTKANRIIVGLPFPVSSVETFKSLYLKEPDGKSLSDLFYKIYTNMDGRGNMEFVQGYAEIDYDKPIVVIDDKTVSIPVKRINDYSAMSKAAWQMLRSDLPQYAYDNYDNSDVSSDWIAAIRSLITAFSNIGREVFQPFERKAENRRFAENIDFNRSMVRLYSPGYIRQSNQVPQTVANTKTGGGSRVKKIEISDQWLEMVETPGSRTSKYGQLFDYTTIDRSGQLISSGIAAYEPQIGNEENPFHEPEHYIEKVHWSSDRYHHMVKPYCESYFPGPSIGYSKVTVTSFGDNHANGAPLENPTGQIIHEFYTAKDFPTIVDDLKMDKVQYETSTILKLFTSTYIRRMVASQGFKVELNDMHGKPKMIKVVNKAGDDVSSSEYFYKVKDQNAEEKELNNAVDVLEKDGTITENVTIATEVDVTTDVRQSLNGSSGTSIGAYPGGACYFIICTGSMGFNYNQTVSKESFNSISTVKVIHRFGILAGTRTMQNGSFIETENLLWDGETGEVALTRTQNEFDDYTYAFNYVAHKALNHEGMGAAYKNIGAIFFNPVVSGGGKIQSTYVPYFFPGDEVVNLALDQKAWVIKSDDGSLRFIDRGGNFMPAIGIWKIIRSGRRNILNAGAGTVVCMSDPRVNGRIELGVDSKVLDSKAVIWKDAWATPVSDYAEESPALQGKWMCKGSYWDAFCKSLFKTNPTTGRNYLLSYKNDNVTVGDIIRVGVANGYFDQGSNPLNDFFYRCNGTIGGLPEVDQIVYYLDEERTSTNGDHYTTAGDIAYFEIFNDEIKINSITIGSTIYEQSFIPDAPLHISSTWSSCAKTATYDFPITSTNYNTCLTRLRSLSSLSFAMLGYSGFSALHQHSNEGSLLDKILLSDSVTVFNTIPSGKVACTFSLSIASLDVNVEATSQCVDPVDRTINPYFNGILGTWRPYVNYVYTVKRDQKPGNSAQPSGTNIRKTGSYSTYNPFWNFTSAGLVNTIPPGSVTLEPLDNRWVWSNKSVYFDQKGNEIENVDALSRYGSALFGYQQSLAIAVGANARHNEIVYDGFEDYDFNLTSGEPEKCPLERHFDFGFINQGSVWQSPAGKIDNTVSHTGKYSYEITGDIDIIRSGGSASPIYPFLDYDNTGRYKLLANELAKGFAPVAGKEYLVSFWVNDNSPITNTIQNLEVKINGQPQNVSAMVVPVVEGWKRLELPAFEAGPNFHLELITSGTLHIDDFRILPNDGQLASYVYDDTNLRLVAQLDENNFATFYEYDDEGTPVRVKKETERGIMTLKENRQSFRKRQ